LALERRQVHHPDREVEREDLRLALDRALREAAGPLLERDGVDGADSRQPRLERKLESAWKCRSLRHEGSLARAHPAEDRGADHVSRYTRDTREPLTPPTSRQATGTKRMRGWHLRAEGATRGTGTARRRRPLRCPVARAGSRRAASAGEP